MESSRSIHILYIYICIYIIDIIYVYHIIIQYNTTQHNTTQYNTIHYILCMSYNYMSTFYSEAIGKTWGQKTASFNALTHNLTRRRFKGGRRVRIRWIRWGGRQRADLVGRGRVEASIVHGHDLPGHRQLAALQQNGSIERIINSWATNKNGNSIKESSIFCQRILNFKWSC